MIADLFRAIEENDTMACLYLIEHKIPLNHINIKAQDLAFGKSPLMRATELQNLEFVKHLIPRSYLDLPDLLNNSALHYAVQVKNPNLVSILLESGANPNLKNCKQETPFTQSLKFGEVSCIMAFIDAYRRYYYELPNMFDTLARVIQYQCEPVFQDLLHIYEARRLNLSQNDLEKLILLSAMHQNIKFIKQLFELAKDVDAKKSIFANTLELSVQASNPNLIKSLKAAKI